MADDLAHAGGRDRERIDLGQAHDWWTQKFDLSPDELRAAVAAGGAAGRKVEVD